MIHVEDQPLITVDKSEIVEKASEKAKDGWRFVQVSCTAKDNFELTYSFDKNYILNNIRVILPKEDPVLPSITKAYFAAFTYENELQDLFGIKVTDLALDFKGTFYKLSVKTPFAPQPQQPAQ
jgi:ech hydrogenase subunit D